MLKTVVDILIKITLSAAGVVLFIFLATKLPFITQTPTETITLAGGDTAGYAPGSGIADITLAGLDMPFAGTLRNGKDGSGFSMRELDVAGACEGAGLRYLAEHCPDCSVVESPSVDGEPATLYWHSESQAPGGPQGTIFSNCTERLGENLVRVPLLSFGDSNFIDAIKVTEESVVPELESATRLAEMSLGVWHVVIDEVDDGELAISEMTETFLERGWSHQSKDSIDYVTASNQTVLTHVEQGLCVITLDNNADSHQLVTMMSSTAGNSL